MNMQKDVLYNFLPVGGGGGLQNALSFVSNIETAEGRHFLIRQGSPLCAVAKQKGALVHEVSSVKGRLACEWNAGKRFADFQGVFAIFGAPFIHSHRYFINIGGFAVSNLLYPEIDFWGYCSKLEYCRRQMVDLYRRAFYKKNDFWIFETQTLQERAIKLFHFPEERTAVVKMAPSSLVGKDKVKSDVRAKFAAEIPQGRFTFLFLNGPHPNKRIHLLPDIAAELKKQGNNEFLFLLTMDPSHPYTREVFAKAESLQVRSFFHTVNAVKQEDVASLIDCCDAMGTLSLLESFSNNFVEAWKMGKPLIVTDSDWARQSCRESACYVFPEQADASAAVFSQLMASPALQQEMISKGRKILSEYPTAQEKNQQYLAAIERGLALGKLSDHDRKRIRL